jgi:hypothetical protein
MRECVFTAEYKLGADDSRDVFTGYFGLEGRTLMVAVSNSGLLKYRL